MLGDGGDASRWTLWGAARPVVLAALGVLMVLGGRDLRYAFRVLIRQGSSPSDIRRRPQSPARPSRSATPVLVAPRCATLGALPIDLALGALRARDPRCRNVMLRNLVDMRSGIAFSEDTSFPWVNRDHPTADCATDLAGIAAERPVIEAPPGRFTYDDSAPDLPGAACQRMTGVELTRGPFQELWDALGAEHPASWALDDRGSVHTTADWLQPPATWHGSGNS